MNIVFVVFDSLRADHLSAYNGDPFPGVGTVHTPHLDAFAADAVTYLESYPEALPTLPFRRGLHTGERVFPYHNHRDLKGESFDKAPPGWGPMGEDQDTLAELLGEAGYRTALISDLYHMFKPSKNFHRGFDQWTWIRGQESDRFRSGPPVPPEYVTSRMAVGQRKNDWMFGFLARYLGNVQDRRTEEDYFPAQVFSAAAKWAQENRDADDSFLVVDSFDPHEPWDPPAHYRRMYDPDDSLPGGVGDVIQSPYVLWSDALTERELYRIRANYAGEVTLADRWFGHFIETLRNTGRYDDTLIVVVSDHGHCLAYPGDKEFVGKRGYPMTRAVGQLVTMVKYPGNEGAGTQSRALIQNTDLAATALAAAGVAPRREAHGRDIRDTSGARDHVTIASWGTNITVIDSEWWYNASIWGDAPLLHKHRDDVLLEHNLADEHPDVCDRMQRLAVEDAGGEIPPQFDEYRQMPWCFPGK